MFTFITSKQVLIQLRYIPGKQYHPFATGVACQHGTLTLPDPRFRTFLGLVYAAAPIVETSFPELAKFFLDFSP